MHPFYEEIMQQKRDELLHQAQQQRLVRAGTQLHPQFHHSWAYKLGGNMKRWGSLLEHFGAQPFHVDPLKPVKHVTHQ